jgi:hypothetical protein
MPQFRLLDTQYGDRTYFLPNFAGGEVWPSNEATQFGSGTASIAAEGNIFRQISQPGITPVALGSDIVIGVYTLPANSFDGIGNRGLGLTAQGSFGATTNSKTIKIIANPASAVVGSVVGAGGTVVATTGVVATNGSGWVLAANIFKYGAPGSNTQMGLHQASQMGPAVTPLQATSLITAVESGPIIFAITANCATLGNDVVLNFIEANALN